MYLAWDLSRFDLAMFQAVGNRILRYAECMLCTAHAGSAVSVDCENWGSEAPTFHVNIHYSCRQPVSMRYGPIINQVMFPVCLQHAQLEAISLWIPRWCKWCKAAKSTAGSSAAKPSSSLPTASLYPFWENPIQPKPIQWTDVLMKGISQRWSLPGHVFCSGSVRVTRSARRSIRRRRLHPPKNQCYIGHVRSVSARLANVSLQMCSKRRCLWRHEWFVRAGEWAAREPGWLPKPAIAPAASKKNR